MARHNITQEVLMEMQAERAAGSSYTQIADKHGLSSSYTHKLLNPGPNGMARQTKTGNRKCPHCRKLVSADYNFCFNCGACIKTPGRLAADELEEQMRAVITFVPSEHRDAFVAAVATATKLLKR